ncbi:MAG TPA: SDR family NAD(P)-dependent oxidoreductase [Terriglobales bacterium]|nr:SDR family NAD(P)-dependent oxidoreductase [Terriglobales bacterium]
MNPAGAFSRTKLAGSTVLGGAGVVALGGLAYFATRRLRRFSLTGRTVIITGGSRGLGYALARRFLHRGAKVALLGRDPEALQRAHQLLVGMGQVFVRPCDIRDQRQVNEAFVDIRQQFGSIDVLVNNAGTLTVGPMDTITAGDYKESLDVFFWGPLYTTLAVLPEMRNRRSGRIVNISSIGGKISVPHLLSYSVGKFALAGFSEGMRAELARDNVYVTTVYPGLMRTGSPRNVDFKGKHRAEYTWFLVSDSTPGLTISADGAARKIVAACEYGKAELIITLPAKLAIKAHQLFPGLTSAALAAAARALPAPGNLGKGKAKGLESTTRITESWLTALDRRAAKQNNQIPRPAVVNP